MKSIIKLVRKPIQNWYPPDKTRLLTTHPVVIGWLIVLVFFGCIPLLHAKEPLAIHPKVKKLDFKSPGRATLLKNGHFATVRRGTLQISQNEGETWKSVSKIPKGSGPVIDGGILVENSNGALVLIYRDDAGIKMDRTKDNMPLPGARLQMWSVRSTDGGKTWSDHQRLIEGYSGATIDALGTHKDKFVIPLQELRYNPPRHVTVVFVSSDDGKTWHRSKDLDIGGNGIEDGAFEATIAERADQSLLLFLRTTRDRLWKSESFDSGLTWSLPVPTDIAASNSPAYVHQLKSGRHVLIWNPVYPTGKKDWPRRIKPRYAERPDSVYREELYLAFSSDQGETWTKPAVIAKQPGSKLRYGFLLERKPGEIWMCLRGKWYQIMEKDFTDMP